MLLDISRNIEWEVFDTTNIYDIDTEDTDDDNISASELEHYEKCCCDWTKMKTVKDIV